MHNNTLVTASTRVALAAWLVGCASLSYAPSNQGVHLTNADVERFGARSYPAPAGKVFPAAVSALKAQGYEVVHQDPSTGVIKTAPKLVRTCASTSGFRYGPIQEETSTTTTTQAFRQYTVRVTAMSPQQTMVRAEPQVFIGQKDVSAQDIWDMDGPEGEVVLWRQLLDDIGRML